MKNLILSWPLQHSMKTGEKELIMNGFRKLSVSLLEVSSIIIMRINIGLLMIHILWSINTFPKWKRMIHASMLSTMDGLEAQIQDKSL